MDLKSSGRGFRKRLRFPGSRLYDEVVASSVQRAPLNHQVFSWSWRVGLNKTLRRRLPHVFQGVNHSILKCQMLTHAEAINFHIFQELNTSS